MQDRASVQDHFNQFNFLISKLVAVGVKIEYEERVGKLVAVGVKIEYEERVGILFYSMSDS